MSKDSIISDIIASKKWKDYCNKLLCNSQYPNELGLDLYQEFIIVVLETEEETLLDVYNNDRIDFWCWRIINIMWNSNRSDFYYKYKRFYTIDVDEFLEVNTDDRTSEQVLNYDTLMNAFEEAYKDSKEKCKEDDLRVYEMMTRIYVDLGSFRAMEEELGINFMTCNRYVNRFRDIIKTKYNSLLMDSNWDK